LAAASTPTELRGIDAAPIAAVWQLGAPAPTAAHMSLHYIERNPDPANPLRGQITGAVAALRAYPIVLGKTEWRLVDPVPDLVLRYCSPAFEFHLVTSVRGGPYCSRSI